MSEHQHRARPPQLSAAGVPSPWPTDRERMDRLVYTWRCQAPPGFTVTGGTVVVPTRGGQPGGACYRVVLAYRCASSTVAFATVPSGDVLFAVLDRMAASLRYHVGELTQEQYLAAVVPTVNPPADNPEQEGTTHE